MFPILASEMAAPSLYTLLASLTFVSIIPIMLLGFQTSGRSVEETGTDLTIYRGAAVGGLDGTGMKLDR